MPDNAQTTDWKALLTDAVTVPGILSPDFNRFHRYSFTNRLMAACEAHTRGIELGPLAPRSKWEALGRKVKPEYEKAGLHCWLPIPRSAKNEETGKREKTGGVFFKLLPNWYVFSMTEGEDLPPLESSTWSAANALTTLEIEAEEFTDLDGNTGGYAHGRAVAVNPLSTHPVRVLCHEIAHVLLGHTEKLGPQTDGSVLNRSEAEAEAECVAMLVTATLGEAGEEESRGYVQHWLAGGSLRPKQARRIIKCAKTILDAGYPAEDAD
jgi:hypothetical protein